jgi:hypothetical protein
MEKKTLMQAMRDQYYPFSVSEGVETFSKNLIEALDEIREEMKAGNPYAEFWTDWVDLPSDFTVTTETLDELKKLGFRVVKRYCDKGTAEEHFWFIVAWDEFTEWPSDKEY